ncbi:MAG: hypothetical protein KDJ35_06005 [Alphaproteobacteria bacterium]|nr:hypothetical protein [Alphaproteobacteria bacterium]
MRYIAFLFVGLFWSASALAQDVELKIPCNEIVINKDVQGAEYTPGVDVNGNPVVGADVQSNMQPLNYPVRVPIEIDILKFLDLDIPEGVVAGADQDVEVAFFDVFEDGRVEYNGRDISSVVSHSCGEELMPVVAPEEPAPSKAQPEVSKPKPTPTPAPPPAATQTPAQETPAASQKDGQGASNSLLSGEKLEGQAP